MKEAVNPIQIQYLDVEETEITIAPGFPDATRELLKHSIETGLVGNLDPRKQSMLRYYARMNVSIAQVAERANISPNTGFFHLKKAVEQLWELAPTDFREAHSKNEATKLKDPNVVKKGKDYVDPDVRRARKSKPMSDKAKRHLKDLMTQEEKDRRSKISKDWIVANLTEDEVGERMRIAREANFGKNQRERLIRRLDNNLRRVKNRKERLARKAVIPAERKPRVRDYKSEYEEVKRKRELSGASKPTAPAIVVIPTITRVKPPRAPEAERAIEVEEPTLEERRQSPYKGTIKNLAFLQKDQAGVKAAFEADSDLKTEWQTVHSRIGNFPYFRYQEGKLWYLVEDDYGEQKYEATEEFLTRLWKNQLPFSERTNIINFGQISFAELKQDLKRALPLVLQKNLG